MYMYPGGRRERDLSTGLPQLPAQDPDGSARRPSCAEQDNSNGNNVIGDSNR